MLKGEPLQDHHFSPGFGNHQASRTLNKVSSTDTRGEVLWPMLGLAAAPEIEIASPSNTPPLKPFCPPSGMGAYPTLARAAPALKGVNVKEVLCRVLTLKSELPPRLSAQFTMGKGPRKRSSSYLEFTKRNCNSVRLRSSLSSNPVKRSGWRKPGFQRVAPR